MFEYAVYNLIAELTAKAQERNPFRLSSNSAELPASTDNATNSMWNIAPESLENRVKRISSLPST